MIPRLSVAEILFTKQVFFFFSDYIFDIFGCYITISLWLWPTPNIFTLFAPSVSFSGCHSILPVLCLSSFLLSATFCRKFSCVKLSPLLVASKFTRNKPVHFLNFFLYIFSSFFHTHQVLSSDWLLLANTLSAGVHIRVGSLEMFGNVQNQITSTRLKSANVFSSVLESKDFC